LTSKLEVSMTFLFQTQDGRTNRRTDVERAMFNAVP